MEKDKAKDLLERYGQGLCTDEEKAWVETYYNLHKDAPEHELSEDELLAALNSIEQSLPVHKRRVVPWSGIAAAAAACLIVGWLGWWLFINPTKTPAQKEQPVVAQPVILPGGNKAILTLANGQQISLTDAANGSIAKEAGISITKTSGGQVVYRVTASTGSTDHAFNTIETPVGGQYQVELPDGTKIWLNSKSSLRFPVQFSGTERRVEMTGEAYFEVAHNKEKPFRVVNDQQIIEVLGTHFNINAYNDEEAVKTTLLEGAVKVTATDKQVILKPGEQVSLSHKSQLSQPIPVQTSDIVAWKNNKIQFTDLDIHSIMRMLARWYDIDVTYSGREISTTFGGSVSRSKNIDVMLKLLEATGDVHFKIEGRRVTVMP